MLSELRLINFDIRDLSQALKTYLSEAKNKIAIDGIESIEIDAKIYEARIRYTINGDRATKRVSYDHITRAMIVFCLRNSIPIPRQADKRFVIIEQGYALAIFMGDAIKRYEKLLK